MSKKKPAFAVLIDGDNVSNATKIIEKLIYEIKKHGNPIIQRVFFNKASLNKWEVPINQFSLEGKWVPNNIKGKNAADIELAIDAMELLFTRNDIDGFCIVSSDSDFTGLAKRLKSRGKKVLGIGEQKTPESFRNACTQFVYIEDLPELESLAEDQDTIFEDVDNDSSIGEQTLDSLFIRAYEITAPKNDGRIPLPEIKEAMNELDPDFQSGDYHYTKRLAEAVETLSQTYPKDVIRVQIIENPDSNSSLHQISVTDCALFKFIETYRNSSAVSHDGRLRLSIFLSEIRKYPAYENGFSYRGAKRLKAVKLMRQDYSEIIEIDDENDGNSDIHFVRVRL